MKIWEIIDTVKLSDEKMGICGNTEMEKAGYQANVRMQGLGEQPAIRKLYMEHIEALLK